MKIGFVFDDSLDKPDGVQQYVLTLGNWLGESGHEVHYLVGQSKRTDIANVHSLSNNINVRFNHNRLSIPLPANTRNVRTVLSEEKFDVLHVQLPYSPQMAQKVIKNADMHVAIVGTFHILPFSNKERLGTKVLGSTLRGSLRRFDRIASVSEPARQFAEQTFGVKSVVIPNVVETSRFIPKTPLKQQQAITVTYLGRLVERKGVMLLLAAIVSLRGEKKLPPFRVRIVGSGPLEKTARKYVNDHNLESVVEFVGFVSESEKAQYLAASDIAVFPSTGGESFGIVLIEAMAAGAGVVIGGDNPGYRSVLKDERALFNPTSIKEFAQRLRQLLSDKTAREALHKLQKKQIKQYDIKTVGPQIIAMYQEAIAKRSQSINNGR